MWTIGFDAIELFAKQLHENYRAACKAMGVTGPEAHDHGYNDCGGLKQKYFIKRAKLLIASSKITNPQTLGEAEAAMQALCFVRRSAVKGWNPRA